MDITRAEREELNALSKAVFGVSSKWKKILDNGTSELVTMEKVEEVPGENGAPATTKTVKVPVLTSYGAKQFQQKYYTLTEVKELLLKAKKQLDDFNAAMKKQREEEESKKKLEQQAKEAAGSAV